MNKFIVRYFNEEKRINQILEDYFTHLSLDGAEL